MNKLTNDQITDIWEAMPGQPGGWLKQFGYIQFARAIEDAVSTAVGEPVAAESKITDTAAARAYVDAWHREHFPTDRTFTRYIMNDPSRSNPLAGDFAWQLAHALEAMEGRLAAPTQVSAPQADSDVPSIHDVVIELREYASNPGYSHSDYADTMRQAANCIESLRALIFNYGAVTQASAAQEVRAVPVGYARQSELDKLVDGRVAGVGMMIHKEPGEGKVALYLAPVSTSTAPAAMDEKGGA